MRNLYQEAPILSSITVLDLAIESKRKKLDPDFKYVYFFSNISPFYAGMNPDCCN